MAGNGQIATPFELAMKAIAISGVESIIWI
jgi:hypothetical protein